MIFLIIYYLLFLGSLTSIPYTVFRYVMAGDEYAIATNVFYPIMWIGAITFLVAYAFTSLRSIYECTFKGRKGREWGVTRMLRNLHGVMVSSIYNSIYITIFGLIGYIIGITVLDNIEEVREIFMAVVHLPAFEYFLKGVPLTIGAIAGNMLTSLCVTTQCS